MSVQFSTWYDGSIYEKFIAPQSDRLQTLLTVFASRGSRALDVGCGIGDLSFKLAAKCASVVGVDLSERMISYAKKRKNALGVTNVEFLCANATDLNGRFPDGFDLATMVLFLHEIDETARRLVVEQVLALANTIVIADFSSPFPTSSAGARFRLQEFIAGRRHYSNFRNWMKHGGIDGFIETMGLKPRKTIPWENGAGKVALIKSASTHTNDR